MGGDYPRVRAHELAAAERERSGSVDPMLRCRVFGHRWRFAADGPTMRWSCERGCGATGEKHYSTPHDAARYASAFDRDGDIGRHTPLSVLPVRLVRALRHRSPK
jgi:hypothetical protein